MRNAVQILEEKIIQQMGGLPKLSGDRLEDRIVFTESEIESIAFCLSFVESMLTQAKSPVLLPHYKGAIESAKKKIVEIPVKG